MSHIAEPLQVFTPDQVRELDKQAANISEGSTRAGWIMIQIKNGHVHQVFPAPLIFLSHGQESDHERSG